jgi:glutamate/tyrosine decarboxylase-like PLP-dependent enzyme
MAATFSENLGGALLRGWAKMKTKKVMLFLENCHVTVNKVAAMLEVSHGSPHQIIHDMLQFHKLNAK